jgi:integrase/recombinase XerD
LVSQGNSDPCFEMTGLRGKLPIRFLVRAGGRISEALALEVRDIDFDQGMVTIEHLKSHIRLPSLGVGQAQGRAASAMGK